MIPQTQPQYMFNLGVDPLLANRPINAQEYLNDINREIERLNSFKKQMLQSQEVNPAPQQQVQTSIWNEIDKEIDALTNEQKAILAKDENYTAIEQELQFMIQQQLINSVKDKVAATAHGKELLERQLKYIKERKSQIVQEANKEIETFKKFQVAVQANPNLTYAEFMKTIK